MPTTIAILDCLLQLVIVALALSERCRRRGTETVVVWVVFVVVSEERQKPGSSRLSL